MKKQHRELKQTTLTPDEEKELLEFESMLMTDKEEEELKLRLKNKKLPPGPNDPIAYSSAWKFDEEGNLIICP